jgi:transcriptional regulator with XRE-family HTH domain
MAKDNTSPSERILGEKLKAFRIANDYTPKAFAKAIGGGVTVQDVERFELGKKIVPMRTLEKVFRLFDTHIERRLWRKIGYERQEQHIDEEELSACYEELFEDEL